MTRHFRKNSNGFFQKVYDFACKIPVGKVATYGQIACVLGRPGSARIVGYAISNAPIELNLPCHRIVNRDGEMAPEYVFGGAGNQRCALESEGVTFLGNGCVDMEKHQWNGTVDA